jgi:hypothetical protein
MQSMIARGALISVATLCAAIAACGTERPQLNRTSSLNERPTVAQLCQVGTRSCLSMNPDPAQPCLASPERCASQAPPELIDVVAGNSR